MGWSDYRSADGAGPVKKGHRVPCQGVAVKSRVHEGDATRLSFDGDVPGVRRFLKWLARVVWKAAVALRTGGVPHGGAIRAAHRKTRESYGPERLQKDLAANGFQAGVGCIKRIRKKLGLIYLQKRKFKTTTLSKHTLPVAENLLQDRPPASQPGEMRVTDITCIPLLIMRAGFAWPASRIGIPARSWATCWTSWHMQQGTPLHALQELGERESMEMVRKCAHQACEHLAPYADRLCSLRVVEDSIHGTTNLSQPEKMKGLHRCKPLIEWYARQDSNPRPLGS